jgi:hypothetical protein
MDRLADLEKQRDLTRAALTQKLDSLEHRVRASIEEAGETVKRTVDLEYQVKKRPLVMLGCSALMGYFLGRAWLAGSSSGESGAENGTGTRARNIEPSKVEPAVLKGALTAAMSNLLVDLLKEIVPLATDLAENTNRPEPHVLPESEKQTTEPI